MRNEVTPMTADAPPIAADTAKPDCRQRLDETTGTIIGAAYKVGRYFGPGFLEKIYENALKIELARRRLAVEQQRPIRVRYGEDVVGDYVADLVVEDTVVVEVKSVERLAPSHQAQCLHYLRATGLRVGLLLNFGRPRVEVKRIVLRF